MAVVVFALSFAFAVALLTGIALVESYAAWLIWQWKLRHLWPALAPFVSLSAIFYANLALSVVIRHIDLSEHVTGRDAALRLLSFCTTPFCIIGLVWLLIRMGW